MLRFSKLALVGVENTQIYDNSEPGSGLMAARSLERQNRLLVKFLRLGILPSILIVPGELI